MQGSASEAQSMDSDANRDSFQLMFLENLDGRSYSTSTTFLDIPVKKNSSAVKNQATAEGRTMFSNYLMARISSERTIEGSTYVDFRKSLLPLMEKTNIDTDELNQFFALAQPPSESQWYQLNQLRIHAGAPERSEEGVEKLYQYYIGRLTHAGILLS